MFRGISEAKREASDPELAHLQRGAGWQAGR